MKIEIVPSPRPMDLYEYKAQYEHLLGENEKLKGLLREVVPVLLDYVPQIEMSTAQLLTKRLKDMLDD